MNEFVRVKAVMHEPVIHYEDGMHLDGILAYGAFRKHIRSGGPELPPITDEWALDFDLPLAKWSAPLPPMPEGDDVDSRLLDDNGKVWGWCASAVEAEWINRGKMEFRKKPDIGAMQRYTTARSHHLGVGPFKAFDLAYPTLLAYELEWVAYGDYDGISELLSLVSHIGKKSTSGMGAVAQWDVARCHQQNIARRMPQDGGMLGSIRAPYHHRSRFVPAAMGVWEC